LIFKLIAVEPLSKVPNCVIPAGFKPESWF